MFSKYASLVLDVLTQRGSFDTTPEKLVNHVLEILAGLVQADQIATNSEVTDVITVRSAEEHTLRDVTRMIVDALSALRLVKGATSHSEVPQGLSDELWRQSDKVQAHLEVALDRIDPDELKGWLDSKW
jgi:hypothetical protein